jgi:hypothetical protein
LTSIDPPNGVPVDLCPISQERLFVRDDGSPTPTSGSASSTTFDSKKKHGLTLNNPFRSKHPLEQTPLPPSTPTKAARVLGVNPDNVPSGVPRSAQRHGGNFDGPNDDPARVRYGWPQQYSATAPTASKNSSATRFYEDIEADDEDEPSKTKGFWGHSKMAAKKLSGSLSSRIHSPTAEPQQHSSAQLTTFDWEELQTNFIYSIGIPQPDVPVDNLPESSNHANPAHPRRRNNKGCQNKRQKELERMTPITETSHDNMSAAYRDDGDSTELEVIDEYTHYSRPHGRLVIPPRSESLQPFPSYKLAKDDLSPTDEYIEQDPNTEESYAVHPGEPFEMDKHGGNGKQPAILHLRSPLQAVEDRLLDVTEMELEAQKHIRVEEESSGEEDYSVHGTPVELSKAKQHISNDPLSAGKDRVFGRIKAELEDIVADMDQREASRLALDKHVAALKQSHEKMKKEFKAKYTPEKLSDSSDDDDLPSIRSSIDLDEEPTLHVATAMPILRVTPGMVKLVDILPRKKKSAA